MKVQLTQRDRKLLVFLGVMLAVVVIGYWGIRPLVKDTAKIKEEIELQKQIANDDSWKIEDYGFVKAQNEKLEKEIEEMMQDLTPLKSSAQIDKELTDLILKKNLKVTELTINMPKEDMVSKAYRYAENDTGKSNTQTGTSSSSLNDMLENGGYEPARETVNTAKSGVFAVKAGMVVKGDRAQLENLLEAFYAKEPIEMQVKSYAFTRHAYYEEVSEDTMTVQLELYYRAADPN